MAVADGCAFDIESDIVVGVFKRAVGEGVR